MKKILAITLSILMLFTITACGNGGSGSTNVGSADISADNSADNTVAPPPDSDGAELSGTIVVWCWDPTYNIFAMDEAAKIYREINPNFDIEVVDMPMDEIQTTLITTAASGTLNNLPDIFLLPDYAFQKNVIQFPEMFFDITDSGIPFHEFASSAVANSVVDGRNYGVSFGAGTTIFAVRTDYLTEAGFTVDDFTDITWGQFIELGKVVLEKTGRPMISTSSGGDFISFMLQSAGASLFHADGTPNIANNSTLHDAINTYLELINTGVLLQVNNWDEYTTSFISGAVTGTISGCWIIGSMQTAQDQSGNWAVTNMPRLDIPGGTNYSNFGGSSWAISSNSENAALAIDFLKHTFAGSVEFYENILESSGALPTWLPAGTSNIYMEPQPFFGGQAIFTDIVGYTEHIPAIITGEFWSEVSVAVTNAVVNILGGADITVALQEAEDTVIFQMGR